MQGCPCYRGIHIRREACRKLRQRYGITLADKERMIKSQGGKCSLCDGVPTKLDHCHKNGRLRGVICSKCNVWLAPLDNPDWLVRAAGYIMADHD